MIDIRNREPDEERWFDGSMCRAYIDHGTVLMIHHIQGKRFVFLDDGRKPRALRARCGRLLKVVRRIQALGENNP